MPDTSQKSIVNGRDPRKIIDKAFDNLKERCPGDNIPGITDLFCSSIDNSPDEIYWIDDIGGIIYANKKACSKLGYSPDEILKKNIGEIEESGDSSFSYEDIRDRLKTSSGRVSYRVRHKRMDGTVYDAGSEARYISCGEIVLLCIFSREILQDKNPDRFIDEDKSVMTAVINAVHENVIYYDTDLSIRWLNENPARFTGKEPGDIIGKKCYNFWSCGENRCEDCTIEKVMKTGTSLREEIRKSSGRWIEISGYPVFDDSGNVKGAVESILDITEKKKTEEALEMAEKQLLELFNTMTNAFALHEIITDKNGNPVDYKYLRVNPAFEKMTGFTSEGITGKRFLEVFPGGRRSIIEKFGRIALTGEHDNFIDYNPVLKQYHNIYAYSPDKGKFATIYTDITDLVRLKNEQKLSLEQINRNFEELAILNDEIRNPLQVITGYILLGDFPYSKEVLDQVETINRLVDSLDKRWLESDKIRDFLKKHYDFKDTGSIPIQFPRQTRPDSSPDRDLHHSR